MLLVNGIYCPFVGHRCRRFASEADDICQSFAPEVLCEGRLQERRFCIDGLEYPNIEGVLPAMMVSFDDARRACALEGKGKRLCTVEEWEFACEGTQMWPYPYGTERDPAACNADRAPIAPDFSLLSSPRTMAEGIAKIDERAPSGSSPRCISPFGVRDMTGNVAEWVENPSAAFEDKPIAALKGGSFQRSRARCRPLVTPPSEPVPLLGVGFRCCADANDGKRTVSIAPPNVRIPRKRVMEPPRP
jgi:formylglycine-generating enzyme required for sulfatase activity